MEPATFEGSSKDFIEGPSLHSIQKEANAEAWKKIRPRMQLLNMKPCQPISYAFCALLNWLCSNAENVVRLLFFAIAAFHNQVNLFHIAEEWKVGLCLVFSHHL